MFEYNTLFILFRALIITLGTLAMTTALLRLRSGWKKTLLILGGYLVYTLAVSLFINWLWGFHTLAWMCLVAISLPGILVLYYISGESAMRLTFICASVILFSTYITAYVTLLNQLLHGDELLDTALRLGIYAVCILLELLFLRRPFLFVADIITANWGILSLIPCSLIIFSVVLGQYPQSYIQNPNSTVPICFMGIVIAILYFAIFQYLRMQYIYQMKERNWEILDLQIQNIRKNTADMTKKAEIAKMEKQDTYALLSGIAALAKEGDYKAVLDIVKRETPENNTSAADYCSDPILNATLNSYLGHARNSGIIIETCLSIPKNLPVDSAEFSICLANALENSIKACEKLPKNERKIIFRCTCQPNLMFRIENTYKGKVAFTREGIPVSSAAGHGIGTRSILAFCEKHSALYSFKAEDGWFTVTVAL